MSNVYEWPRLIGGPLHGQPRPARIGHAMYTDIEEPGRTLLYREVKLRFGKLAIVALVCERLERDGVDEFVQDVAEHALGAVGVEVPGC
jgi:hypothetical protein